MKRKYLFILMAAALVMGFAACSEDDDANDNNAISIIDLSTITSDLTLKDGDVVTGKLTGNVKITIADGATVTLQDATIVGINRDSGFSKHAGITCDGDATIVLADNTTNIVNTFQFGYPCIYVPKDKTLTIKGNGKLETKIPNKWDAAGIGAGVGLSCGNIYIQGGTIEATGNAGIGNAYQSSCGDIIISAGTVIASSPNGAAIGSSNGRNIGNIVIGRDVTRVVATTWDLSDKPIKRTPGSGYGVATIDFGFTELPKENKSDTDVYLDLKLKLEKRVVDGGGHQWIIYNPTKYTPAQ